MKNKKYRYKNLGKSVRVFVPETISEEIKILSIALDKRSYSKSLINKIIELIEIYPEDLENTDL
jgi:hypothetical protein